MKVKDALLPVAAVALVVIVWAIAAAAYGVEIILPSPAVAVRELFAAFGESKFWTGVGNTLLRSVTAFAIAFAAAFLLALASVASRVFFKMFYPVVVLLRALPTISVIFICYIAVDGWFRAVIICFLVTFPTLYSSFYTAFDGCRGELAEMSKVYNVGFRTRLFKFILPCVWNGMYSDLVNTVSLTVKLIIAAEAVTATGLSFGGLMAEAKAIVDMGRIFAYTIAAVALSYAAELAVRLAARTVKEVGKLCRRH